MSVITTGSEKETVGVSGIFSTGGVKGGVGGIGP